MHKSLKCAVFLLIVCLIISCNKVDSERVSADFPQVTKPYPPEQAIKNGDFVNVHGKLFNIEKWQAFLKNLDLKKADQVRITQYTVEGSPIFYELTYDGNLIRYTYDNSMDAFGSDLGRPSTDCNTIGKTKRDEDREGYVLKGCENTNTGNTFWFGIN